MREGSWWGDHVNIAVIGICYFSSGPENHIEVNMKGAQKGDIATLVSPAVNVSGLACLEMFLSMVEGEGQMDIHTTPTPESFLKRHLCTVAGREDTEWQRVVIDLPSGTYHLVMDAVVYSVKGSGILIDNVTVTFQNCSLLDYIGKVLDTLVI